MQTNQAIKRSEVELQFLPAALEIQETPPNPAGRALLWCVIAIVVVAFAWAALGHVDIVAVAPGKLIPSDRVKVIQPLATAQVRAIHVRDGQAVKAGDVLIELDPTLAQADSDRLADEQREDQGALARHRAFAAWLHSGKVTLRDVPTGLQRTFLEQMIAEHRAKLAAIDHALERRRADREASARHVEKGERTLPLISTRAASLAKLASDNLVAKNSHLELEQQRIEAEQDLAAQRANLQSIQGAIGELLEQRASAQAEAQRATSQAIETLDKKLSALRQELRKADTITEQQLLTSPVAQASCSS